MRIEDHIKDIRRADRKYYDLAMKRWDGISMPLGGLGVLQEDIARIAALTEDTDVRLLKRSLIIACADNGVVCRGVSQSDASVTFAVACALGKNESTASYMAKSAICKVIPVDIGMEKDTPSGVRDLKIRRGTYDISCGPAMTREECEKAIILGIELVKERKNEGDDILLIGEMGIGNTTTSSAVCSVLLDREPSEVTGRGAGLSDEALDTKISMIREAIGINDPDKTDAIDVISKVGGFDIAFLTGICMGGIKYRIPVILDGVITDAAALCAVRICEESGDALIASHVSKEPAASYILEELELSPAIAAGLHLGEGTGALLLLPMLDMALSVYDSGHTFDKLGIGQYVYFDNR